MSLANYTRAAACLLSLFFISCETPITQQKVIRLQGETMGTTYSVTVIDPIFSDEIQPSIDSLLIEINREVNTYDSTSMISELNRGNQIILPIIFETARLISERGGHFAANLALAINPIRLSNGSFEPTIGPLTEYYGFGASRRDESAVNEEEIQQLLSLVGFGNVLLDTLDEGLMKVSVARKGVRLDLSAIAKGYAVDQVAHLLQTNFKSNSFLVEIGGETRAAGHSPRGSDWTIGINRPLENAGLTDFEMIIGVKNAAIASSGNYRNRRIIDGVPFVHTIDPKTGEAKPSALLSATVIADNCATADAFATASMASAENAEKVLAKAGLSACLIFAESDSTFETRFVGDFQEYIISTK